MTDIRCGYSGDRNETLMCYLYDDITAIDRSSFEAHLATCAQCREELEALRGVRAHLTTWAPPQPNFESRVSTADRRHATRDSRETRWWREIPVWAQLAAAVLVLGVAAGIANLNVHYGSDGLTVRTGWST